MKRIFYIIFWGLILTTGCSKFGHDTDSRIGFSIGIGNLDVDTKVAVADVYDETMISKDNPFETAVWFSLDDHCFANDPDGTSFLPCHTTMSFKNTGITYASYEDKDLTYPIPDGGQVAPVYCVGFYPKDGWSTTDGTTATHEITGSEDLMFAPKISGNWIDRFSEQTYNHQLTWLKINVCATTMEAGKQWGDIAKVEVRSDKHININLETGSISFNTPDYYITTFENTDSGVENVDEEEEEEENPDDEFADQQLTLNSLEVGSVFCSPEKQYSIRITMESGVVKELEIPLKNLNGALLATDKEATGKLFVINLYFQPFAIVEGTSMLYYWNNKNEDLLPD